MATLWFKSGSVEFDNSAVAAAGALAYFYAGGTTNPLTVYSDADEASPHEHPVEADGNGRWPTVFIPFTTSYDLKVTTSGGPQLYYPTEIPNADPVEAAEDTADAEELLRTGDCFFRVVDTTLSGCVRLNGRTMGNAASGGTERANADTVALFTHLYDSLADDQAPVSTGRGANAAADYAANKTITLPDLRGAFPLGLDDMGNSAASLLDDATFEHGDELTPGSVAGANTHTLVTGELASHSHTVGTLDNAAESAHTHTAGSLVPSAHLTSGAGSPVTPLSVSSTVAVTLGAGVSVYAASVYESIANHTMSGTSSAGSSHDHNISGTTANTGSDTAHNNLSRCLLVTWFIKL